MSLPREKNIEFAFASEIACIKYLLEKEVLNNRESCPFCSSGLMKRYKSKPKIWHCNNKCNKKIPIFSGSFFAKNKIKCHDLLRVAYKWLSGQKYTDIVRQVGHSSVTVSSHLRFCRELVAMDTETEDGVIGGPGMVVEVDESKFGKRKYHRGHRVEGVWVVGGIERTEQRRAFLVPVPDRKAENTHRNLR